MRIEYVLYDFPDTAAGNMMKGIYASFAQFERDTITERNTRGRLLKVRGGSVMMHGATPYGYRLISGGKKNHRLEICEGEARVLRMIFDWYAWGEEGKALSIGEIVRRLTALGIPTPADVKGGGALATKKRGAGEWSRSTVNYLLKSETLAGVWHYAKKTQGKNYPVNVPAIIDPETWAASQTRLKGARLETGRKPTHDYLMGRRVRCGLCKRYGMAGQHATPRGKLYLYYMCLGRTQDAATKCAALKVRAHEVDAVIWAWIRGLLLDPAKITREIKTLGEQTAEANSPIMARLKDCDDLLANNARESGRLADLYTGGLFSLDDVSEKKHRLDAERESIANERARIAAQLDRQAPTEAQVLTVCAMMEKIAEKLPYADQHFDGRRQLIEALDVHCTVTREAEGVVVYASCIVGKLRLAIPANSIGNVISTTVSLVSGGRATFTVTGTVSLSATGTLTSAASVTAPSGITDSNSANNSATDTSTVVIIPVTGNSMIYLPLIVR